MGWLHSLFFPLKKLWLRTHTAKRKSKGIHNLYEDVKSCPNKDVHILWSILVESPALSIPSEN
ncbi:hypothetical protein RGQ29_014388 [Quercus rubra]|uniref:Uncharacterized protein n=1 Tax=Quercus rubra TaxID=3512 RepID=A0AAN7FL34_QUERU|nr:hypothetical protein RGQ29_014388 [Quercus rubra]